MQIVLTVTGIVALLALVPGASLAGAQQCLYLEPYNLHLTPGETSSVPLRVVDARGKRANGPLTFGDDSGLLSIDSEGYVTGKKAEGDDTIGEWLWAETQEGDRAVNFSVVRVLDTDYGVRFKNQSRRKVVLRFPTALPNSPVDDIESWVKKHQMLKILDYSYRKMSEVMMLEPFDGCRQIFEVDLGDTEANRVCGINGNPIRLGWNIQGEEWNNCFILHADAPQWGVILHELAHNFTLPSQVFWLGLAGNWPGMWIYSEHGAQVLSWAVMEFAQEELSLNATAGRALPEVNAYEQAIERNYFDEWVADGAKYREMGSAEVNTIWVDFLRDYGEVFAQRYFYLLAPQHYDQLEAILGQIEDTGAKGKHAFFAALVSAAAGEKKFKVLKKTYHFKMKKALFNRAWKALNKILTDAEEFVGAEIATVPAAGSERGGCVLESWPAANGSRSLDHARSR